VSIRKVVVVIFGISLLVQSATYGKAGSATVGPSNHVTVDNRPGKPSGADYTDINTALISATPNTRIYISEGDYVVDNPLVLTQNGIRVIGNGRDKTIIYPMHFGKSVFTIQADNISIEDIEINAKVNNGFGRATFGIHIEKGTADCEIVRNAIHNTGASAIVAHSIRNCLVQDNVIVNSGDDAIQMRGPNLTISGNLIYRYFDEAIDVASGGNIKVINNYVSNGRIGIVVDDARDAIIAGNIVDDNLHRGIILDSDGGGIVSYNSVKNGGVIAYLLYGPLLVVSNRVEGNNNLGFELQDMYGAVVHRNVIVNAGIGMNIMKSNGNICYVNEYCGNGDATRFDSFSHNSQMLNGSYCAYGRSLKDEDRSTTKRYSDGKRPQKRAR